MAIRRPDSEVIAENDTGPDATRMWGCFRAVVVLMGLLALVLGGGIVALCLPDRGWWGVGFGIAILAVGGWWIFASLFGNRSHVDMIFSEFLGSLLGNLLTSLF